MPYQSLVTHYCKKFHEAALGLACKYIGGLLCLAIPLGVCDAESDHVFAPLMKWGAD